MVVNHEISTYKVLLISGYTGVSPDQVGFIYFNDTTNKYIGYAGIIRDGKPLPPNVQWTNGILNIYFNESELPSLLDTLRNEKPIFVQFNTDLKWGSVGTAAEPVGEEEALHPAA